MYNALVDRLDTNKTKHYYGTCEKNFKERYNNHTASFRNKNKEKSTELSKYIWELKDNNIQHNLKWRIASKAHPCMRKWKVRFMLNGKINHHKSRSLNTSKHTRYELVSKCRHMNKFTLRRFKKKIN